jgi:hypothetical protein
VLQPAEAAQVRLLHLGAIGEIERRDALGDVLGDTERDHHVPEGARRSGGYPFLQVRGVRLQQVTHSGSVPRSAAS